MKLTALALALLTALGTLGTLAFAVPRMGTPRLSKIPDQPLLAKASDRYQALFEIRDDAIVGKHVRDERAALLGILCWQRIVTLFPLSYRKLLIEFNVHSGRGWAGKFDGSGKNDLDREGYRLSVARYLLEEEKGWRKPHRATTARRGTLDWTLVHELGHYICLRTFAIELFSQKFHSTDVNPPERRDRPTDYAEDGSPTLDGNFVTSYAERVGGDEEVVETFTTYMLIEALPENDSLVARKIRFFETMPGYPELRQYIQTVGKRSR